MNIITQAGKYDPESSPERAKEVWIRPIRVEIDPVSDGGEWCPKLLAQLKEAGVISGIKWPDTEGGQWYTIRFTTESHPYIDLTEGIRQMFTFDEARDLGLKIQAEVTRILSRAMDLRKLIFALDNDGQVTGIQETRARLDSLSADVKELRGTNVRLGDLEKLSKYLKERVDNIDKLITGNSDVDFGARISMLGRRATKTESQMEEVMRNIAALINRVDTLEVRTGPQPVETPPKPRRSRKPRTA